MFINFGITVYIDDICIISINFFSLYNSQLHANVGVAESSLRKELHLNADLWAGRKGLQKSLVEI